MDSPSPLGPANQHIASSPQNAHGAGKGGGKGYQIFHPMNFPKPLSGLIDSEAVQGLERVVWFPRHEAKIIPSLLNLVNEEKFVPYPNFSPPLCYRLSLRNLSFIQILNPESKY